MSSQNSSRLHRFRFCFPILACVGLVVGATAAAQTSGMSASAALTKSAQNADLWPAPGRDNDLTRFSPLKQIDTSNASNLQFMWSQSLSSLRGQEVSPLIALTMRTTS